ncbi:MAG TPA: hypothetical protein VFL53_21380 [Pseudolabrys sp.]|nr:hypothetical protein [Pseudolabrys sp.]
MGVVLLDVQPGIGKTDLLLEGARFSLEQEQLHVLSFALNLEAVDDVVFPADFGALARITFLELFDGDLKTPRHNCKIRALQIFVGLDFGQRLRHRVFYAPGGQPHRTPVDHGHDAHRNKGCKKETDPEVHDRFDHAIFSSRAFNATTTQEQIDPQKASAMMGVGFRLTAAGRRPANSTCRLLPAPALEQSSESFNEDAQQMWLKDGESPAVQPSRSLIRVRRRYGVSDGEA